VRQNLAERWRLRSSHRWRERDKQTDRQLERAIKGKKIYLEKESVMEAGQRGRQVQMSR